MKKISGFALAFLVVVLLLGTVGASVPFIGDWLAIKRAEAEADRAYAKAELLDGEIAMAYAQAGIRAIDADRSVAHPSSFWPTVVIFVAGLAVFVTGLVVLIVFSPRFREFCKEVRVRSRKAREATRVQEAARDVGIKEVDLTEQEPVDLE